jgi:hypothetical protein
MKPAAMICQERYSDKAGIPTYFHHDSEDVNHAKNTIQQELVKQMLERATHIQDMEQQIKAWKQRKLAEQGNKES